MKRLITIIWVLISLSSFAQTFKPTVKKITLDSINARTNNVYINDPLIVQDTTLIDLIKFHGGPGSTVNFGTDGQVPFMNLAGSDFQYSDNFKWDGRILGIKDDSLNTFVGYLAGYYTAAGERNTFLGYQAGRNIDESNDNIMIGYRAGTLYRGQSSYGNIFIGNSTGNNAPGSNNIFIGDSSGYDEAGSGKLYIENSNSATPLVYGDFVDDTLRINGTLDVTGDIVVGGEIKRRVYEAAAYVPEDSTLTTSATTAWQFLGTGANNKFVNIYAEGFSLDGDTLLWTQDPTDLRDSVEFNVSWSSSSSSGTNGITVYYGLNIKNDSEPAYTIYNPVTRSTRCATSGQLYALACTPMPIFLKDGAKIQIVIKASGAATITTEDFGIYLKEE